MNKLFFLRIKKLFYLIIKPRSWIAFYKLVLPSFEHRKVLKLLQKRNLDLIIDVGSNKGQFTFASKIYFPKVTIFSFEALKSEFKKYINLISSFKDIKAYNYALGNIKTKTRMNIASSPDSSSLLEINEIQSKEFGTYKTKFYEEIEIRRLDEWLDQIKKFNSILMKIDVQGFELEVLKGSKHVLKHINYLYIEASSVELYKNQPLLENIKDFLFEEGFFLEGSFNQSYGKNKKLIQGDYLFSKLK